MPRHELFFWIPSLFFCLNSPPEILCRQAKWSVVTAFGNYWNNCHCRYSTHEITVCLNSNAHTMLKVSFYPKNIFPIFNQKCFQIGHSNPQLSCEKMFTFFNWFFGQNINFWTSVFRSKFCTKYYNTGGGRLHFSFHRNEISDGNM